MGNMVLTHPTGRKLNPAERLGAVVALEELARWGQRIERAGMNLPALEGGAANGPPEIYRHQKNMQAKGKLVSDLARSMAHDLK